MSHITSFIKTSPCVLSANSAYNPHPRSASWWVVLKLTSKIRASVSPCRIVYIFLFIVFAEIYIQTISLITADSFKEASQSNLGSKRWRCFSISLLRNQLIWGLGHPWPARVCLSLCLPSATCIPLIIWSFYTRESNFSNNNLFLYYDIYHSIFHSNLLKWCLNSEWIYKMCSSLPCSVLLSARLRFPLCWNWNILILYFQC